MKTPSHFLKRNPDNEPVCACGFRPGVLDTFEVACRGIKARTEVLDHVDAMLGSQTAAPFVGDPDRRYPRAGVRRGSSRRWRLTLWDEHDVSHALSEPWYDTAREAFDMGQLFIDVHRQAGTRLNGMGR
ncbi:hypothetical protein [Paenarthrobacter nicotinovorans]|uniref:hypothetical protein n=1 Tax=Paenarthrobacter nicotinovorans TaxID=29320 RepID=UPI0024861A09|nr:hypothetical protein [Paenarthrobacter nicotinovorans]MDI2019725.1 hypothetical protein [Paenarthrobacter nicotinovorans]